VESSAGSALLTMADPSASHPGHLMNGDAALPSGLTASATSPHGTSTGVQAVHDTADPTSLLSLGSPVSGEQVTLTFTQSIGASDLLRSGGYGKAFVFTISTTSP